MNDQPIIRPAVSSDLNALIELEQICFDEESFSRSQLRYLISKARADFLLTEASGEISSFIILLKRRASRGMRIYSVAVSPKFRGKGLARILLHEAARRARTYGFRYLTLEVSENNTAAIRLYLNTDFEVFGEKLSYYKNGSKAFLMRKEIS